MSEKKEKKRKMYAVTGSIHYSIVHAENLREARKWFNYHWKEQITHMKKLKETKNWEWEISN